MFRSHIRSITNSEHELRVSSASTSDATMCMNLSKLDWNNRISSRKFLRAVSLDAISYNPSEGSRCIIRMLWGTHCHYTEHSPDHRNEHGYACL